METPAHVITSLILAAAFFPLFKFWVLLILVGGVMIDIDHYIWFVLKRRNISPFDCYRYFTVEAEKSGWKEIIGILLIFHTVEFLALAIAFSFYSKMALAFTIGLLSHYLLDAVFLSTVPKRLIASISLVSWFVNNKIQKV